MNQAIDRITAAGGALMRLPAGQKAPPPTGFPTATPESLLAGLAANDNTAIRCGNGLVVIDLDKKPDTDGLANLQAKEKDLGALPPTLTVTTPSGGRHLYFTAPSAQVRNGVSVFGGKSGIDIRSDGGYVVAPPSSLPNGSYTFVDPEAPIAELPTEWLAALKARESQATIERKVARKAHDAEESVVHVVNRREYLDEQLDNLVGEVESADEGGRNQTLNDCALRLFRLALGNDDILDADEVHEALDAAAKKAGLGATERSKTLASALDAAEDQPLKAVEPDPIIIEDAPTAPTSVQTATLPVERMVFATDQNRFIFQAANGDWGVESMYKENRAITARLWQMGYTYTVPANNGKDGAEEPVITTILRDRQYQIVKSIDLDPSQPPIFEREGEKYLNTYRPPKVQPVEGPWPRIDFIIDFHCDHDPEARKWFEHFLAYKVQHPGAFTRSAVVINAKEHSGKSTLASVMREILGPENTGHIEKPQLSPDVRFNGFLRKLFLVVEEADTNDNGPDITGHIKNLTGSPHLTVELKGLEHLTIQNRLTFMFLSNEAVPVQINSGSTRFTVLRNTVPPTAEHKEMVRKLHSTSGWAPDFIPEIQGFFHYLLNLQVDETLARQGYATEAREDIIDANKRSFEIFVEEIEEIGLNAMLREFSGIEGPAILTNMAGKYTHLVQSKDEGEQVCIEVDPVFELFAKWSDKQGFKSKYRKDRWLAEIYGLRPQWRRKARINLPNGMKKQAFVNLPINGKEV